VDFTDDPQNTGNPDRFVTAQIPVDGDSFQGGGNQFNVNAKGSQLSIDVRWHQEASCGQRFQQSS